MCLWAIYIFPGSVHIFPPAEKADPSWEYLIRSQTHECGNSKLALRSRYSFSGNICFEFAAFCLCSAGNPNIITGKIRFFYSNLGITSRYFNRLSSIVKRGGSMPSAHSYIFIKKPIIWLPCPLGIFQPFDSWVEICRLSRSVFRTDKLKSFKAFIYGRHLESSIKSISANSNIFTKRSHIFVLKWY